VLGLVEVRLERVIGVDREVRKRPTRVSESGFQEIRDQPAAVIVPKAGCAKGIGSSKPLFIPCLEGYSC
jgi:hypothetical protein